MAGRTQTQDETGGLKITFHDSGKYLKWQSEELEEVLKSEANEKAATSIFTAALLFVLVGVLFHYVIYLTN